MFPWAKMNNLHQWESLQLKFYLLTQNNRHIIHPHPSKFASSRLFANKRSSMRYQHCLNRQCHSNTFGAIVAVSSTTTVKFSQEFHYYSTDCKDKKTIIMTSRDPAAEQLNDYKKSVKVSWHLRMFFFFFISFLMQLCPVASSSYLQFVIFLLIPDEIIKPFCSHENVRFLLVD